MIKKLELKKEASTTALFLTIATANLMTVMLYTLLNNGVN